MNKLFVLSVLFVLLSSSMVFSGEKDQQGKEEENQKEEIENGLLEELRVGMREKNREACAHSADPRLRDPRLLAIYEEFVVDNPGLEAVLEKFMNTPALCAAVEKAAAEGTKDFELPSLPLAEGEIAAAMNVFVNDVAKLFSDGVVAAMRAAGVPPADAADQKSK